MASVVLGLFESQSQANVLASANGVTFCGKPVTNVRVEHYDDGAFAGLYYVMADFAPCYVMDNNMNVYDASQPPKEPRWMEMRT